MHSRGPQRILALGRQEEHKHRSWIGVAPVQVESDKVEFNRTWFRGGVFKRIWGASINEAFLTDFSFVEFEQVRVWSTGPFQENGPKRNRGCRREERSISGKFKGCCRGVIQPDGAVIDDLDEVWGNFFAGLCER